MGEIFLATEALAAGAVTRYSLRRNVLHHNTPVLLGRRLPFEKAIIRIDALLNATGGTAEEVASIAERYTGARGIRTRDCHGRRPRLAAGAR